MKQIINSIQPVEKIGVKEAVAALHSTQIVAYVTAKGTGLGVLQACDGGFGFVYHSYLVQDRIAGNYKYEANTLNASLKKAVDAGRTVIVFDSFDEFLVYSVKHTKL